MRRVLTFVILCMFLIFSIAGCSSSNSGSSGAQSAPAKSAPPQSSPAQSTPAQSEPVKDVKMVIATGGTSGSYFPLGGAFANLISNKVKGFNITAQTSGGSIENLKLIEKGQVEFGLAQNDLADYAIKGTQMFDKKLTKIRAIATIYPEYIHIAVRGDQGINSIADLKGKKISVGAPGSGSEANCRQFLQLLGVPYESFKAQFLENTDAANQLKDNVIDGMIITTGLPSPAIQDIALTKSVKVLGFTKEEAEKITKEWPFLTSTIIPANSYKGQTEDVLTMTAKSVIFTSVDVPEDVIYKVTKALWENQQELAIANGKAKSMKKDKPVEGVTVPVHPGALKYYNEIGVKVQ